MKHKQQRKRNVYSRTKKRRCTDAFVDKETGKRKESSIEKKFREWLETTDLVWQQEYFVKYQMKKNYEWKTYDFLIGGFDQEYFLLIECDGNFFHNKAYVEGTSTKQTKLQKKNVKNDKRKDFIAKKLGMPLMRFWEDEIKFKFEDVAKKVINEINRQKAIKNPS